MNQQSLSYITNILLTAAVCCLSCYAVSSNAQVYYPTNPDYHSALVTNPILAGTALPYDTPITPAQVPTIPPNAAFGLEHQSAYVVPTPRVITQQKMGIVPAGGVAQTQVLNPMVSQAAVVSPTGIPNVMTSPTVITTPTSQTPSWNTSAVYGPEFSEIEEQHPGAAPTRFFTTVPTTTYSDELPLTISIAP